MKVLKKVILSVFNIVQRMLLKIKSFSKFIVPNIVLILNKRIFMTGHMPACHQLTRITGRGKVEIGDCCSFGYKLGGFHRGGMIEIQPRTKNAKIKIGSNVATNNNLFFCAASYIEIGEDSLLGQYVTIMDHEAHGTDPNKRRGIGEIGTVIIGKNVWIGNNVIVLKNSIIGDNTIVAAGAVVSGKFPSNVIIGGVPAKVIKKL